MAVTADKPAPYAPPTSILDVIERYRNRGLPSPINAEVLGRAGIPDSLIPRTLQALQTLDLIDGDGKPTDTFEGIRTAPEAEFKDRLANWLNGVYADVISFVDPSQDDEIKVRDAFRNYNPVGQQPRMVTLFLALYAAAGVAPEKKAAQTRQPRSTAQTQAKRRAPRNDTGKRHKSRDALGASSDIPAALAGLLASLPQEGSGWTKERREKFVTTFGAVLDFCFPVVEHEAPKQEQDDDEEADP